MQCGAFCAHLQKGEGARDLTTSVEYSYLFNFAGYRLDFPHQLAAAELEPEIPRVLI